MCIQQPRLELLMVNCQYHHTPLGSDPVHFFKYVGKLGREGQEDVVMVASLDLIVVRALACDVRDLGLSPTPG